MENVVSLATLDWSGRKVFLTGHTGFKGSWLCHWLEMLGCEIHGFALDPPTEPNLFSASNVAKLLASDTRADLRDAEAVSAAMRAAEPELVFHLAAQPLVREGYRDPLGTFAANVMGTAHILDAARTVASIRAVVVVTTDKVYENREWHRPYTEAHPLGGYDPYSASKAAAEIVSASFRSSYFQPPAARIATARAGNVIGGGDWAKDRLIPDCLAAFAEGRPVTLRYPHAVRPWQHVLEPLAGYIMLGDRLFDETAKGFDRAWNFGPNSDDDAEVGQVAQLAAELWGEGARVNLGTSEGAQPHEAGLLKLDSTLAQTQLGWVPRWSLRVALEQTIAWQKAWSAGDDMRSVTRRQIDHYLAGSAS
jgi:CDP-glucose 4,6-dehydratase